jgi:Sulfotransferase family
MHTGHVLVTGAHRSGTTWVGRTLAHHPSIVYIQEPFNVSDPNHAFGYRVDASFYYVPGSSHETSIHAAFTRLFRAVSQPYQFALSKCQGARRDLRLPLQFGRYLLRGVCLPTRAVIKDPFALMSAGWLHAGFGLQVICLIRNPLAFAGSLKHANWPFDFRHLARQAHLVDAYFPAWEAEIRRFCEAPGDIIDQACLLWNLLHAAILRHRETYPHWLFLRHEDLARSPLIGFQQIFAYVGLRMTSKLRTVIEHDTSAANPVETYSPAYTPRNARGSLETWRTRLTAAEIERVIHATRDIAGRFYELRGQEFV